MVPDSNVSFDEVIQRASQGPIHRPYSAAATKSQLAPLGQKRTAEAHERATRPNEGGFRSVAFGP